MNERDKAILKVIVGLSANPYYVHDKTFASDGLAKNIVMDATKIIDEFLKPQTA